MANKPGEWQGSLKMRIARRHADEYDALIKESNEACDCQDCQTCMKLGIQVFDWIIDADQSYRQSLYKGESDYDPQMEGALAYLIRRWCENGEAVVRWAKRHVSLGFDVMHLDQFCQRLEEARAIIRSLNDDGSGRIMSEPLILLRDRALEEHRNGETAEFF
jgi:hypothetical protein